MSITWLDIQFQLPPAALHFALAYSTKQPPLSGQDLGSLFNLMTHFPSELVSESPLPLSIQEPKISPLSGSILIASFIKTEITF